MARRVQELVPDCVGISVASRVEGVTFTLVATDAEIAVLDAVQYLTGGPCVDAIEAGHGLATTQEDLLSEDRWRALGQASAAVAVRSTLTLPIMRLGEVVGTVNLYGGTENAFAGQHAELARVFEAWAPGAVSNADLEFSTRQAAERAPEVLRSEARVDVATALLAESTGLDLDEARAQFLDAARRAGVSPAQLADAVIRLRGL